MTIVRILGEDNLSLQSLTHATSAFCLLVPKVSRGHSRQKQERTIGGCMAATAYIKADETRPIKQEGALTCWISHTYHSKKCSSHRYGEPLNCVKYHLAYIIIGDASVASSYSQWRKEWAFQRPLVRQVVGETWEIKACPNPQMEPHFVGSILCLHWWKL